MGLEKLAELKAQLAAEAKPTKHHKTNKSVPVDPIVLVIGKLQRIFPKTFTKNPAPKVPLKVGILGDLVARSEKIDISEEDIKKALKTWCRSQRYWSVTIEGTARIDLDGNSAGIVTAIEAAQAKALLARTKNKKQGL